MSAHTAQAEQVAHQQQAIVGGADIRCIAVVDGEDRQREVGRDALVLVTLVSAQVASVQSPTSGECVAERGGRRAGGVEPDGTGLTVQLTEIRTDGQSPHVAIGRAAAASARPRAGTGQAGLNAQTVDAPVRARVCRGAGVPARGSAGEWSGPLVTLAAAGWW